jgi:phage baseplate assembly protein W
MAVMSVIRGMGAFRRTATSLPEAVTDDDALDASVRRIVSGALGDRVMRSGLGSRVRQFIWENTGKLLRSRVRDEVFRALAENEPRIDVDEVDVAEEKTTVTVTVTWHANGREPVTTAVEIARGGLG